MIYSVIGIISVIVSLVLVTTNRINASWYSYLIYVSALFVTYGTTMVGCSVVGSDISRELLMSNLALGNGWDLSIYDPSNTSVLVGFIIPTLSKITSLSPIWIYKAILPLAFAFTPVILHRIFKPMIGEVKSFYACMFFVIMPILSLEVATIGKSMVAEPIMAMAIWITIVNMDLRQKCFIVSILTVLTLWVHYTIGLLLCIYLCAFCGWYFIKFIHASIKDKKIDLKNTVAKQFYSMAIVFIIAAVFFVSYYSRVADGLLYSSVEGILFRHDYSQSMLVIKDSLQQTVQSAQIEFTSDNVSTIVDVPVEPKRSDSTVKAYSLILSGLGLDIFNVTPAGAVFRIIQVFTQGLVVIGLIWVTLKRKLYKFKEEYLVGCWTALGLLGLCVVVPAFASLINATRQYHIALMFLAPCFVLAFDWIESIFKKKSIEKC